MYDTSIYLSLSCKLYAAKPSVITGVADSNSFLTLVSLRKFLGALTLCFPTSMNLKRIFSAVDLCFRKVFRDRLYLPSTADIHYSVSPSYCFCYGGTWPEQGTGNSSLWPDTYATKSTTQISAHYMQMPPYPTSAASEESQNNCFKHSQRGNSE